MGADDDVYLPSSMRANKAAPAPAPAPAKNNPFSVDSDSDEDLLSAICKTESQRDNSGQTEWAGANPFKSAPRPYNEPKTEPEHAQAQDENDDDYDDYGFDDFDVEEL